LKVEERLDAIERELAEIKIGLPSPQSPRVVKLKGLWKDYKSTSKTYPRLRVLSSRMHPTRSFYVTVFPGLLP
jgi:hypothetical protein